MAVEKRANPAAPNKPGFRPAAHTTNQTASKIALYIPYNISNQRKTQKQRLYTYKLSSAE